MKKIIRSCTIVLCALGISLGSYAQEDNPNESTFNKLEAFSPLFMNGLTDAYHSATGHPGPEYWQNRADYKIEVTLDTAAQTVTGDVVITYVNNSPYNLDFLWLQLDQNTFKSDSRGSALYPASDRNGVRGYTDGYNIKSVAINKNKADYIIDDTRMQIRLDKPVKKEGGKVKIHIAYSFEIPTHGKDRMGRVATKNGTIYTIAQWYPRMAVFDEVEGWNTLPYIGTGEFYLEYGDFDYTVTAPSNMLVTGSGVLQNPKDVLTKTERDRLDKARESDETVMIYSLDDVHAQMHGAHTDEAMSTWHFKMTESRDIAWAASTAFIWDAARINLPDEKTALAQSFYPEENSSQDGYGRSTEYVKHSIELYSKKWYPYTYQVATNVGGHEGGMEYPGIVFCSYKSKNASLWNVINHEFGHNWFPMIVGSNERKYAWLDEGLNTFINDISTEDFNNGEYYKQKDFQALGSFMFNEGLDPLFTKPDVIHNQRNLGLEAYYKPAAGLNVLRNVILGKDRFDYAFKQYIDRWAFKHPQPWDLFNTLSSAAGEDLGWFFKGWFMNNWAIDQAVESVDYVNGDYTKGATITLANLEKLPMPIDLQVNFDDQTSQLVHLPVEIWVTGSTYVYPLNSSKKISSVVIDPNHLVPDKNPGNNSLEKLDSAPEGVTAQSVIDNYLKAVGGREKLTQINDVKRQLVANVQGMPLNVEFAMKKPDKYLQKIAINGNTMLKIRINGKQVNVFAQGREQEVTSEQKAALIANQKALFPELSYADDGYTVKLLGQKKLDGQKVYVLHVTNAKGESMRELYSASTHLKLKQIGEDGSTAAFSDYKVFDGIKLPTYSTMNIFGRPLKLKLEKAEINQGLKDSIFE